MNANDLRGRAVVTLTNATKVGEVDDVLFDPEYREILGFRIKTSGGLIKHREAVPRENLSAIGADALTVAGPDSINSEDRFDQLLGAVTLKQVDGTKVVTESGQLLGVVRAVEIDDAVQNVLGYVLSGSLWERVRHRQPYFAADKVLRVGDAGIMIVADATAQEIEQQS